MKCFFRRLVEAIVLEFVLSLSIILFYLMGLVKTHPLALIFSAVLAVVYLIWTVFCLFGYRMSIDGKKTYYKTNLIIYSILSVIVLSITVAIHFLEHGKLFNILIRCNAFLFFPFKVFYYLGVVSGIRIGLAPSAAMLLAIIFIIVIVLPLLVNKRKYLKRHWELEESFDDE